MGEIDKTITTTVDVTIDIKWILADTLPTAPTDYEVYTDLDIDLGQLGKLWAFRKTA